MEKCGNTGRKRDLWCAASMMAPVTQAASTSNWEGVLAAGIIAVLLGYLAKPAEGWVVTVQGIWSALVAGRILQWSGLYWPGLPITFAVPFVLLGLAAWTVMVPGKAGRIGCILLWPIALLLGAVQLSGIKEIALSNLKPVWDLPDLLVFTVLLFPALGTRNKTHVGWPLLLAAAAASVIAAGVLSYGVSREVGSGIYELSRSLSLLGVAERFESLVAAAMTLGIFAAVTYLLEAQTPTSKGVLLRASIAALVCLLKIDLGGWFWAGGSIIAWIVLPYGNPKK